MSAIELAKRIVEACNIHSAELRGKAWAPSGRDWARVYLTRAGKEIGYVVINRDGDCDWSPINRRKAGTRDQILGWLASMEVEDATTDRIRALRSEAQAAQDDAMVRACDAALEGDARARTACIAAMAAAAAQE